MVTMPGCKSSPAFELLILELESLRWKPLANGIYELVRGEVDRLPEKLLATEPLNSRRPWLRVLAAFRTVAVYDGALSTSQPPADFKFGIKRCSE